MQVYVQYLNNIMRYVEGYKPLQLTPEVNLSRITTTARDLEEIFFVERLLEHGESDFYFITNYLFLTDSLPISTRERLEKSGKSEDLVESIIDNMGDLIDEDYEIDINEVMDSDESGMFTSSSDMIGEYYSQEGVSSFISAFAEEEDDEELDLEEDELDIDEIDQIQVDDDYDMGDMDEDEEDDEPVYEEDSDYDELDDSDTDEFLPEDDEEENEMLENEMVVEFEETGVHALLTDEEDFTPEEDDSDDNELEDNELEDDSFDPEDEDEEEEEYEEEPEEEETDDSFDPEDEDEDDEEFFDEEEYFDEEEEETDDSYNPEEDDTEDEDEDFEPEDEDTDDEDIYDEDTEEWNSEEDEDEDEEVFNPEDADTEDEDTEEWNTEEDEDGEDFDPEDDETDDLEEEWNSEEDEDEDEPKQVSDDLSTFRKTESPFGGAFANSFDDAVNFSMDSSDENQTLTESIEPLKDSTDLNVSSSRATGIPIATVATAQEPPVKTADDKLADTILKVSQGVTSFFGATARKTTSGSKRVFTGLRVTDNDPN